MTKDNFENDSQMIIILDVHPCVAEEEENVELYLNAVTSFCNLYLAFNSDNCLAVLAASHSGTSFIYPIPVENNEEVNRQSDGRLEMLSQVDLVIQRELKKFILSTTVFSHWESLLAGALGRALLFVRRKEALNSIAKTIDSKILIIKNSNDSGGQYLNYINMFLTAQKMKVAIDTCIIGQDSGLLQQGADITGGYYHKIKSVKDLLQSLIMLFLPSEEVRSKLALPSPVNVDYRASCFCHRSLVDMANVCSNCLSIYCKAVPLCSTCNVFFKVEMPLKKGSKKKR